MQVVDPDPHRLDARDLVVRERALGALALAAVMLVVAGGWSVGPWWVEGLPNWTRAAVSGVLGLPLCWIAGTLACGAARGLRRERWTLRLGEEGLWLCPRSFHNDATGRPRAGWLHVAWDDVLAVRPGEQRAHVPDDDGGRTQVLDRWLDLELARPLSPAVVRALEAERAWRGGTRFHVHPLELRGERCLRVHWQNGALSLAPARERVLAALGARVSVQAPHDAETDDLSELSREQVEVLARDLHSRGRVMDAVRVLRARHGWSLGRASAWLRAGEPRAAG
jgi:hypothetical protein